MIKIFLLFIISIFILTSMPEFAFAQSSSNAKKTNSKKQTTKKQVVKKEKKQQPNKVRVKTTPSQDMMSENADQSELQSALNLAKSGNYEAASIQLFNLSRSPRFSRQRMQIKYLLGLMLYDMKLYQTAAFHFVDVVRDGNSSYIKKSLEKLSLAADKLGDETLLNYALSKVKLEDFPAANQDMLKFRIGEYQFRNGDYSKAAANFGAVDTSSPLFGKSKYMQGLSFATSQKNELAIRSFQELSSFKGNSSITDETRVAALMGLARTHYQNKEWDEGIALYRQVPRDTEAWHEALFEISWAEMRAAKFRSVLGNMHSLHSPFYEDFYMPESLLLRSIVYLYICQFDEMEKTLDLFKKIYQPVRIKLRDVIKANYSSERLFREIEKIEENLKSYQTDAGKRKSTLIPYVVSRKIIKESDFSRNYDYIKSLYGERQGIEDLSSRWRTSALGMYAKKILATRIERARETAGTIARRYIQEVHRDTLELFKQHDLARFELLNGKKEQLKTSIVNEGPKKQIEEDTDRSFYIQNGYEYWPFQGEYWLDEIGNYYYLGKSRCESNTASLEKETSDKEKQNMSQSTDTLTKTE